MRIGEILSWLDSCGYDYIFTGTKDTEIAGFSSLGKYVENTVTWVKREKEYENFCRPTDITCAIVQNGVEVDFQNTIVSDNSKELFFAVLHHFWGEEKKAGSIGQGTVISEDTVVDCTAVIGCNCSIIGNVVIGAHTVIEHNVVIQGKVQIGRNCHIQSGVVIGIAGYGFSQEPETKYKTMVEHFGGVIIGDDVFIGSHVNIARGTIDDTIIESGVKIAPSTHIGHNNTIGKNAAIICSVLYGSVKTGAGAYITASTVGNQITVGSNTVIGMGSVVTKTVQDNMIAYGIPAREMRYNDSLL